MIVMKFGGTSVGTAESIRETCRLITERKDRKPFVVVSAHNSPTCRMTDTIVHSGIEALAGNADAQPVIDLQHQICKDLELPLDLVDDLLKRYSNLLTGIKMIGELSDRTYDLLMSFGERMSHRVVAEVISREFDAEAVAISAMDLGLLTDANYGSALPDESSYPTIKKNVEEAGDKIIITTGFMGTSPEGHIATLGRGGSDFSATIFGAALDAEEVQIWTDVDGVMTADPKVAPKASSIPELSFTEASELSWYGAKVLHPSTMIPAKKHNIPVRVLNTHKASAPGTLIVSSLSKTYKVAKSIAHHKHIKMVTITSSRMLGSYGFMAKVFEVFSENKIDIHMISTSEVSISLSTPATADLSGVEESLSKYGDVTIEEDKAIVCIVGENMAGTPGVAAKVTTALANADINIRMISQGANEINIALLINATDADKAVSALHKVIFED